MRKKWFFFLQVFLPISLFSQPPNDDTLYVGTYTAHGSYGIYMVGFNPLTGEGRLLDSIRAENPSYLKWNNRKRVLYAVKEINKPNKATIAAFSYTGNITRQKTGGADPCYIETDRSGRWLAVANYSSGSFSLFRLNNKGEPGRYSNLYIHPGSGPDPQRQEMAHIHCTIFSADNKFLLVSDLGSDSIITYSFNERTGLVRYYSAVAVSPGSGPRHIIFHPDGRHVYASLEMSGEVVCFAYDNGKLTPVATYPVTPQNFKGKVSGADLHLSPNGKFLYASNRGGANNLAIFGVRENGLLEPKGTVPSLGTTPRNFAIHPSGKYLLVANQDEGGVAIMLRNPETGELSDSRQRINIPSPVCLEWAK